MKFICNYFVFCLEVMALWNHTAWTNGTSYQSDGYGFTPTLSAPNYDFINKTINVTTESRTRSPSTVMKTTSLKRKCQCQNGGTCIRGLPFCDCPREFKGRFCQNAVKNLPCGNLKHGESTQLRHTKCQVCHCYDGKLTCDDTFRCEDIQDLFTLMGTQQHAGGKKQSAFVAVPTLGLFIFLICQKYSWYWF